MQFENLKTTILSRLKTEIRPCFYYHDYYHTFEVWQATRRMAESEGIDDNYTTILETAALLHDIGMLESFEAHEEASVRYAKKILPTYGYSEIEIEEISHLILATQLPQQATTIGEKIICDADLDYLGRDDFFIIAHRLKYEWKCQGRFFTLKEWYELQAKFLKKHHYFTKSAIDLREEKKRIHLDQILELLNQEK
jgi:predicted metal-dependent HD superfamily phosphohydrolase